MTPSEFTHWAKVLALALCCTAGVFLLVVVVYLCSATDEEIAQADPRNKWRNNPFLPKE